MKDKQNFEKDINVPSKEIIFNCDVDCIKKNTEECFELECIYGQESILKQLSRKEQECEALREEKAYTDMACEQFEQQLDQLKEQLEAYKMEADEGKEINAELKAENEQLKNFHINLVGVKECEIKELARYKQALEKIKEICTKYKEICANCEGDEYIDCVDCTEGGEAQVAIKVLQICDEVNDAQDNL